MTNRAIGKSSSALAGIVMYLGSGTVSALVNIAFVPLYLREMGREGYGLVGFWVTVTAIISLLDLGASATVTRELARCIDPDVQRDLLRSMEVVIGAIVALVAGVGILVAGAIAQKWFDATQLAADILRESTQLLIFAAAVQLLVSLYTGALIAKQKHASVSGIQVFGVLLRNIGAAAAIAWYSQSPVVFFGCQALGTCVTVLLFRKSAWSHVPGTRRARFSVSALRSVTQFAFGMMGISITSVVLTHMDKLLLSRWLPLRDFGTYSVAWTAASALLLMVGPFFRVFAPRFSELHSRNLHTELQGDYTLAATMLGRITCCIAVFVAINAQALLYVWTGNESVAHEATPILRLLILGSMCNALMSIPFALQLAYGWTKFTLLYNAVAIVILVPALWAAVSRWGAVGGASMWILINGSYIVLAIPYVHYRLFGSPRVKWLKSVGLLTIGVGIWAMFFHMLIPEHSARVVQAGILILELLPIGALLGWLIFSQHRKSMATSKPALAI
jgi:O-antigen/teichoic acid export membrane protein